MNSRERVLAAINHAEPDRVPMDFHGNAGVLERLHRDLGTHRIGNCSRACAVT